MLFVVFLNLFIIFILVLFYNQICSAKIKEGMYIQRRYLTIKVENKTKIKSGSGWWMSASLGGARNWKKHAQAVHG